MPSEYEIDGDKVNYVHGITSRFQEYHREALEGAPDVKTFEIINNSFAKDKNQVWYQEFIIDKADIRTFTPFTNSAYSKDANLVWYGNEQILEADLGTFSIFPNSWYAKDINQVYYVTKIIPGADANSFELTDEKSITKDKNHVYLVDDSIGIIPLAKPASFQSLKDDYSKDDEHVFYKKKVVSDCDATSFTIKDRIAQDRQFIFYKGEKLDGLNVNTFRKLGKKHLFFVGENVVSS
jgi:hypothetical protein